MGISGVLHKRNPSLSVSGVVQTSAARSKPRVLEATCQALSGVLSEDVLSDARAAFLGEL